MASLLVNVGFMDKRTLNKVVAALIAAAPVSEPRTATMGDVFVKVEDANGDRILTAAKMCTKWHVRAAITVLVPTNGPV